VELRIDYRARNTSDKAATPAALAICDPEGRLYPSAGAADPLVPAGAVAELQSRFQLAAAFDPHAWVAAFGGTNGPRVRLVQP
jgi:hypothetical protein